MERKQVVVIMALAIAALTWRMGAMQQTADRPEIILATSDGKRVPIDIPEAKLFGYIGDMISDYNLEKGDASKEVFTLQISQDVFQRLINDIPWVKSVRNDPTYENNTPEERAVLAALALPKFVYSDTGIREAFENLKAAYYLRSPELVERYARMIADMLLDPQSLELLHRNNPDHIAFIQSIEPLQSSQTKVYDEKTYAQLRNMGAMHTYARLIYKYIPHEEWLLHSKYSHAKWGIVSDDIIGVFAPNGQMFITQAKDLALSNQSLALLWDLGRQGVKPAVYPHSGVVKQSMFSPDNKTLLTVAGKTVNIISLSDVPGGDKALELNDPVASALWAPTGTAIITAAGRNGQLWKANTCAPIGRPFQNQDTLCVAEFSPKNDKFMTVSQEGIIQMWSGSEAGKLLYTKRLPEAVRDASFSLDGTKVGVVCGGNKIIILDARSGEILCTLPHNKKAGRLFSSDGNKVVTAMDAEVSIRNSNDGNPLRVFKCPVDLAIISPDGTKLLIIAGTTGRIWDAQTGALLSDAVSLDKGICSAAFSPDSSKLLIADKSDMAAIWVCNVISFDQALLYAMIEWAKKNRRPGVASGPWAAGVIKTFDPVYQKAIKEACSSGKKCVIQ